MFSTFLYSVQTTLYNNDTPNSGRVEVAGVGTLRVGAALCAGALGIVFATTLFIVLVMLFAIWIV